MPSKLDVCPICLNAYGGDSRRTGSQGPQHVIVYFECDLCGRFGVSEELLGDHGQLSADPNRLSAVQRSRLMRYMHDRTRAPDLSPYTLSRADIGAAILETRLPSPGEQAVNIVRWLGDRLVDAADSLDALPLNFFLEVGAPSPRRAGQIIEQLIDDGTSVGGVSLPRILMSAPSGSAREDKLGAQALDLTLRGWGRYESERRGDFAGNYGFVALQFGHEPLDVLLRDYAKPAIKEELGFDLLDMRDAARAGVIDNVMREKIRDSAFVIADLSTGNSGAYWEAGYAEGLGKPVLYIGERTKFGSTGTHFDTNHCTTVIWEVGYESQFVAQLTATLRRSLAI